MGLNYTTTWHLRCDNPRCGKKENREEGWDLIENTTTWLRGTIDLMDQPRGIVWLACSWPCVSVAVVAKLPEDLRKVKCG